MSKPVLSDEEMYSTLDAVLNTISQYVPVRNQTSSFPDKKILEQLQQQGYNSKTSWAFLRAAYWYLRDRGVMAVDPSVRCHLTEKITEDTKTDLCMEIFSEYERYLQANYECSLMEPNSYQLPKKSPSSSPGFFGFSESSGGK